MSKHNFVVDQSTSTFLFNAERTVVYNAVYCLLIALSVPESNVVLNRTKFWTFFALPNIKGAVPPKSCTCVNTPSSDTSRGKVSLG